MAARLPRSGIRGGLALGISVLLISLSPTLVCAGAELANVELKDASPLLTTIPAKQTLQYVYFPPRVGRGPAPWNASDSSSRWVRVDAYAQTARLALTVTMQSSVQRAHGSTVGLVQRLGSWTGDESCLTADDQWSPTDDIEQITITVSAEGNASAVNILLYAQAFDSRTPIPGGCCLTCVDDNDPALRLDVQDVITVAFSQATINYPPPPTQTGQYLCNCDSVASESVALSYAVYRYDSPHGTPFNPDLSESVYFEAIGMMLAPADIVRNGVLHSTIPSTQITAATASSHPGQLAVYAVVAMDAYLESQYPKISPAIFRAAYTAHATYACSVDGSGPLQSCASLVNPISTGLSVGCAIVGLYLALTGHRYFLGELACIAVLLFTIATHIVLATQFADLAFKARMLLSGGGGLVGAAIMLAIWRLLHWSSICLVFIAMSLGAVVGCVVFATPIGTWTVWQSNLNFATSYACICVFVPVLLILRPRVLSMISSSFVGVFALLCGLDYFIGSSFSSIALNIIDRATMPGFATAYSGYIFGPDFNGQPFGAVDEAMFLSWIGGSLACLALQHWVTARMNIPSSREPLCASPEEDEEGRPLLAINRRGPPQRRTRTKYGTEDGYTSETA
eukprot:m.10582 g.10582  ORF g.10582 m.10582 type:complete len:625 (-) comp2536_c0_seq2:64-1938(-)